MKQITEIMPAGKGGNGIRPLSINDDYIDKERERQIKSYFVIDEIRNAWEMAYDEYIYPLVLGASIPEDIQIAIERLEEIHKMLALAMGKLYNVGYAKLFKRIKRLKRILESKKQQLLSYGPDATSSPEKFLRAVADIYNVFDSMSLRSIYPAYLPRMFRRVTGKRSLLIETDAQQRLQSAAKAALSGLSSSLAGKLAIPQQYLDAFNTLNLPVWSKSDDVENKRRELARLHHPDKQGGDAEKMKEINRAADLLLEQYFVK